MRNITTSCVLRRQDTWCNGLFYETITDEGICYTFNMLSAEEMLRVDKMHNDYVHISATNKTSFWTIEKGYSENSGLNAYPFRVVDAGEHYGLSVQLEQVKDDHDPYCWV